LFVFDQEQSRWFRWNGEGFEDGGQPVITHPHVCGTGTRFLDEGGAGAIDTLFARSFA
jgi:hypothetical protein